jgi:hypothetical protein
VCRLLRQSRTYFLLLMAAAVALRALFVVESPRIGGDTWVYGELAKNWLQHGILGLGGPNGIQPTYLRLPGYPAFLAVIWAVRGVDHYRAVLWMQMLFDLATCFLVADLARRTLPGRALDPSGTEASAARAAKGAFLLAALCPFTANYVACALAETLAIFCTALALELAVIGLDRDRLRWWALCGVAIAAGILLRPDGGILLAATGGYLAVLWLRSPGRRSRFFRAALVLSACALAPLVPWTVRNWRSFGEFQPLAPRYATGPGESVAYGWERWVKTWIADYVSVSEIYWKRDEEPIEISRLPERAFDSPAERVWTERLLAAYNDRLQLTPELDPQFAALAAERVHHAPLRYYAWLPAMRIASMWLRPRTEMLDIDERWWEFAGHPADAAEAVAFGALNLLYIAAAVLAVGYGPRGRHWGLLLTFVALRSLFLGTLENPEPRYVLECYPVIMVFGGAALARITRRREPTLQAAAG